MARPLKTKEELKKETEEAFLKEFGITKEAAEKSAAGEKRYIAPRDAAKQKISDSVAEKAGVSDDVFEKIEKDVFESRKRTEESERKFVEEFVKEFNRILKDSSDYVTEKQAKGKIVSPQKGYGSRDEWYQQSDDDFDARYDAAEEYVMSEGKNAFENTVKGMFNRFRSAPGEAIEDFAYFLNDTIPEDAPGKLMSGLRENAGNVVEKNKAGSIGDQATEHFNLARENAGAVGNKLIDVFDAASTMMGYGMAFGPSHLALSQSIGEGLDEYRYQREIGADKSEALTRGGAKGVISYFLEKSGGIGKNDIYIPKLNTFKVTNVLNSIAKNAFQEGKEGLAEYTINKFADMVADAIFDGEASFDLDLIEAFDEAITGAALGGVYGGVKSLSNINVTSNGLIENDLNSKKRNAILKNSYINVVKDNKTELFGKEISEIASFPPKAKSSVEKKIKNVAEKAGIFDKEFKVNGIDFTFEMSKGNGFKKSLNNQTKYQGSFTDLTKTLVNLDNIIPNAILLESHTTDKYKGTKRENPNFEQGCTLLGAFQDGDYIIPVKITVKKDKGVMGNLYVVVAMDKIKRTGVLERDAYFKNMPDLSATDSVYKLPQIISNVNKNDAEFLKHIPDEMLSFEQKLAKNKVLQKENENIEKKKIDRRKDEEKRIMDEYFSKK